MAAQYPTSAADDSDLYVAVNQKSTVLTDNPLAAGAVTVNVTDASLFPSVGAITIDAEIIHYTGKTATSFTGCTRGFDNTSDVAHTVSTPIYHRIIADHHNVIKDEIKAIETDLINVQASITPVTATDTATSILNRVAMIVNQIKTAFGLTNWYDSTGVAVKTTTNQSIAGVKEFTGQLIGKGTTTNDDAASGYIGEYIVSTVGNTLVPTSTQFGDMTSISLSAGDWDVSVVGGLNTVSPSLITEYSLGISTTSGNSSTGLTQGLNYIIMQDIGGSTGLLIKTPMAIPSYRVSLSSTTTVYLKFSAVYSGGSHYGFGSIHARRRR